ncbi:hypothetical protein DUNSADRAFT_4406 [Dunaliella salina]|uniref:Encoded protein n=1 Tax=Dunaliella salina TaxID=3046 RepID=A0ABQ7GS41_DUNSA|nr:hypothetical protein DUNSADRAFT_4406 [Dunaliella salina]|eukprot:KAF5837426.1 hypothetical protein DUNSADRAFT_4406 [Dunaliella salina]
MQHLRGGHLSSATTSGAHAPSLRIASRPSFSAKRTHAKKISPLCARRRSPLDVIADSIENPILRTAVKEPVAFLGGIFAGILGLNLEEEPLKSFLERSSGQASDAPRDKQQH